MSIRLRSRYPTLRDGKIRRRLTASVDAARDRFGVRIIRSWIEENRAVLLIEAPDRVRLAKAMQGLGIRFAKSVHRALGTRGPVLEERYHVVVLRNRRQVGETLNELLRRVNRGFRSGMSTARREYITRKEWEDLEKGAPLARFGLLTAELVATVFAFNEWRWGFSPVRNAGAEIRDSEREAARRMREYRKNPRKFLNAQLGRGWRKRMERDQARAQKQARASSARSGRR